MFHGRTANQSALHSGRTCVHIAHPGAVECAPRTPDTPPPAQLTGGCLFTKVAHNPRASATQIPKTVAHFLQQANACRADRWAFCFLQV